MEQGELQPGPVNVRTNHMIREQKMTENRNSVEPVELLIALNEKKLWIVVVAAIAALIGWVGAKYFVVPKYEASINMIVNTKESGSEEVTNDNISSAEKLVDTYAIIIKSNVVLTRVIQLLDLDMSYNELYSQVSVKSINGTQVMNVSVQNESAELAESIVKTISEVAPAVVVDAVEAGSCKVVSYVYADKEPVSPDVFQTTVISGVLGCAICIAILVLQALASDRIVDEIDVERKLNVNILGIIPDIEE